MPSFSRSAFIPFTMALYLFIACISVFALFLMIALLLFLWPFNEFNTFCISSFSGMTFNNGSKPYFFMISVSRLSKRVFRGLGLAFSSPSSSSIISNGLKSDGRPSNYVLTPDTDPCLDIISLSVSMDWVNSS